MKLKLVTICIVVLFICAAVPLATTAAPTAKHVEKPIHKHKSKPAPKSPTTISSDVFTCDVSQYPNVLGNRPVGTMTLDLKTGAYHIAINKKLAPNTDYMVGAASTYFGSMAAIGLTHVITDSHGHAKESSSDVGASTVRQSSLDTVNMWHQSGYKVTFVVYPSP